VQSLRSTGSATVVPASAELLQRGVELSRHRPDKDWPLTDCISFMVMNDFGLTEALTGDSHFQQAGFKALMRE
jgi:predicted nucleic acid-binding protein